MPDVPGKLPSVRGRGNVAAGFRAAFGKLNQVIDYLDTLKPILDPNSLLAQTRVGTVQLGAGKKVAGLALRQFIMLAIPDPDDEDAPEALAHAIKKDYLLAFPYSLNVDGEETIGETEVPIARDWLLRRTPFEGNSFEIDGVDISYAWPSATVHTERTATLEGGSSETQVIVPHYFIDGVIYAAEVDADLGLETDDDPPRRISLMEVSSRAWALKT
jgi:hypothetical protein